MNRLDLPVPKVISHMTREEYNDLVLWFAECAERQINLMADLFDSKLTEAEALDKRQEIFGITKLVTERMSTELNRDVAALAAVTMDTVKYKLAFPNTRITPMQARILASTGAYQELLKGLTL